MINFWQLINKKFFNQYQPYLQYMQLNVSACIKNSQDFLEMQHVITSHPQQVVLPNAVVGPTSICLWDISTVGSK